MNVREKALLMIESVEKALANGCRHYDPETGELLPDVRSILTCLAKKKNVMVQEPDVSVAQAANEILSTEDASRRAIYQLHEPTRTAKLERVLAREDLTDERISALASFVGRAAKDDHTAIIDMTSTEVLVAGWCRIMGALQAKASAVGGRLVIRGASETVRTALALAAPGVQFVFEEGVK